jgi:hypothetical protein
MPSALRNQAIVVHQTIQQVAGLPKTGQTTSYANYDDGWYKMGNPVSPRFTNNGNGTVTDNATGLMWLENPSSLFVTWSKTLGAAIGECEQFSRAGHTDWRLPNINELFSIINRGREYPACYYDLYTDRFSYPYWTSTSVYGINNSFWTISFTRGEVSYDQSSNAHDMWPVRGGVS